MKHIEVELIVARSHKGTEFHQAVSDALILALTENQTVILRWNTSQLQIDPRTIITNLCCGASDKEPIQ